MIINEKGSKLCNVLAKSVVQRLVVQDFDAVLYKWESNKSGENNEQYPVIELVSPTDDSDITIITNITVSDDVHMKFDLYVGEERLDIADSSYISILKLNFGDIKNGNGWVNRDEAKIIEDMSEVVGVSILEKIDMIKNEIFLINIEQNVTNL